MQCMSQSKPGLPPPRAMWSSIGGITRFCQRYLPQGVWHLMVLVSPRWNVKRFSSGPSSVSLNIVVHNIIYRQICDFLMYMEWDLGCGKVGHWLSKTTNLLHLVGVVVGEKWGICWQKNRNLLYCVPPGGRAFAGCDSCDYLLPQIFSRWGESGFTLTHA